MNYKELYQEWVSNPYFDDATKEELGALRAMRRRWKTGSTWIWNLGRRACAA